MHKPTHGSLFSGVGGFDLGFDTAGFTTLWQVEKDKKCRSVLAKHWPTAIRYDDVETVNGHELAPVDVISFGSPCQDLSVAGKQQGLKGSRSKLFFEATRIIKEMQEATHGQYPKVCIWENVKGALSSNTGKDFRKVISTFAKLGAVDIEWRVLNTSDFGPPQRRQRVFVVVNLGANSSGSILAVPTRVLWCPPTGGETGEEVAGEAGDSVGNGSWSLTSYTKSRRAKTTEDFETWVDGTISPTLNCFDNATESRATILPVYVYDGYNQKLEHDEPHRTLRSWRDSSDFIANAETAGSYKVRRLTPRECERLQGWPDDHTRWADTGKELSDSARYKMIGNGVSAPVAQWIGENLRTALGL